MSDIVRVFLAEHLCYKISLNNLQEILYQVGNIIVKVN